LIKSEGENPHRFRLSFIKFSTYGFHYWIVYSKAYEYE
jgi:hypothetical protein